METYKYHNKKTYRQIVVKSMKVTIITSCFNRASTIGDAIESVLGQDYPDIEYIIVDGASKDGTLDVLRKYDSMAHSDEFAKTHPHFTFRFISEPDHGMYEGINKGLRMATGDIVGLVHSDDFLFTEHTLTDIVREFEATGADFVYGASSWMPTTPRRRCATGKAADTPRGRYAAVGCLCILPVISGRRSTKKWDHTTRNTRLPLTLISLCVLSTSIRLRWLTSKNTS